jgi:phage-related protein
MRYFETIFLEEADQFIRELPPKVVKKLFYNVDLAEQTNDPKLFKKLQNDIWEFRISYLGLQVRLLAFWDKSDNKRTLVVATHGFFKKGSKVPSSELDRAENIRKKYLNAKW